MQATSATLIAETTRARQQAFPAVFAPGSPAADEQYLSSTPERLDTSRTENSSVFTQTSLKGATTMLQPTWLNVMPQSAAAERCSCRKLQ
jgi:hypothetical protein